MISYGSITSSNFRKSLHYNVRLDNGENIVVDHELIRPQRDKPLKKGCRLAIQFKGKKVEWASTDLSSRKAGYKPSADEKKRPNKPESNGGGGLRRESVPPKEPSIQSVKVINVEPAKGVITFRTMTGQKIRVRLPKENPGWKDVFIGRVFDLETTYGYDLIPRYSVIFPSKRPGGKPGSKWEKTKQHYKSPEKAQQPHRSGTHTRRIQWTPPKKQSRVLVDQAEKSVVKVGPTPEEQTKRPQRTEEVEGTSQGQAEKIQVDQIGIAPEYFRQKQQEGHRHEIMAFLADHLHDDLIEWYRLHPAQRERFRNPSQPLTPSVDRALRRMDPHYINFFKHQARALDTIRSGKNLVIVTQTASGKTLCYNPAIFEHFVTNDPSAHALYLFPLNALLMDQKGKLDQLARELAASGVHIQTEVLKGGIPRQKRHALATHPPQILALNPELLSVILGEVNRWQLFFAKLRYVVIDEVHTYRGILGMHTAGLIRRLLLATRRQNNTPQFILSSATVYNPMDLATRLTSLPVHSFHLLDEKDDGSKQACKHWVVLNPNAHDQNDGYDNYLNTAAMTMVELLTSRNAQGRPSPLNTILFAKSIREVKKVYKLVQENLKVNNPELMSKVRHYVSSDLSTEEKREIYNGLKDGQLVGVISTNALEAGIDIGKLDACIVAGFPFWVMRMRQMAGRVGRHDEGLVLFVPHPIKPLDQYYRNDPELLLNQRPEAFVVDAENPYIARKHINAAAHSLNGLSEEELELFGSKAVKTAQQAIQDGVMHRRGSRYYGSFRSFKNIDDPYAIAGMRSNTQFPYTVCKDNGSDCQFSTACLDPNKKAGCGRQVAVLDQPYAYRDCHPGAIYEAMDGEMYKVTGFNDQRRVIWVDPIPETTIDRTFVEENTEIAILGAPRRSKLLSGGAELHLGEVLVTRSFTGFYTYSLDPVRRCRRCKRNYELDVQICPSCKRRTAKYFEQSKPIRHDFPTLYHERGFKIELRTIACWMTIPAEFEKELMGASPCKLPGTDNGVLKFLKDPKAVARVAQKYALTSTDRNAVEAYIQETRQIIDARQATNGKREIMVFPGVYQQCLLNVLRSHLSESRALDVFSDLTKYPVTEKLNHVCRNCHTTVLYPAMHTLEHTVYNRYPSVALGDPSDLASHTSLGHPATGKPTIFWYDNYEGGLGAADKVFDQIELLLEHSERTLTGCSCTTLEGCPNCTQIGNCDQNNESLTKPGALFLIAKLLGKHYQPPLTLFTYSKKKKEQFEGTYKENEYASQDLGIGEEAPSGEKTSVPFNPYDILRIQKLIHSKVLKKAYEVRSAEITDEIPAISAVDLTRAFQEVSHKARPKTWEVNSSQSPYQILEIQPEASFKMVQQIYRVVALEVHPDHNPHNKTRATEMMQLVNAAYNRIIEDKKKPKDGEEW
jgi:ATP-dependent helicase YprA (DUF1998 family)